MVGVSMGVTLNIRVKFDALVYALLEYWNRNYSDLGNLVQKPKVPVIPATHIPGKMFEVGSRKKRKRNNKA
jgi:hypothetical protein